TGWRPIVFVTTPPHPASKARRMFDSDSVGGAEERRNGFSKRRPVKMVDRSVLMGLSPLANEEFYARGSRGATPGGADRRSRALLGFTGRTWQVHPSPV